MDKWMTRFIKISNIRYYIYILPVAKKGTGEVCLAILDFWHLFKAWWPLKIRVVKSYLTLLFMPFLK